MYSPELEVIAQKEARGIDLSPEERATVEGLIDPETPNAHPDFMQRVAQIEDEFEIPKLMDEQRRINLEEYVAQKRAEYELRVKDVADAETKKATENIRKQAKSSLTPEEIHKYTVKAPADDAAIKLVEDEADELIKTVLDSVDSVEDRARLEAEINAELERHGFKAEKKVKKANPTKKDSPSSADRMSVNPKTDELLGTNNRGEPIYWSPEADTHYAVSDGRIRTGPWTEGLPDSALSRLEDLLSGKPAKVVDSEAEVIADQLSSIGDDTDMITAALELPDEMSKRVMQVIRERNNAKIKELNAKPPEVGVSAEKAIDAMIPCVTAKAKL
jgi:hypothetical protein